MPDTVKFEIEINLQDLAMYRQTGEEDWSGAPISFTQAVVDEAARQLVHKIGTDQALVEARDQAVRMIASEYAAERVNAALSQPVRKTNSYGEPTGAETTVTELIDAEIKRQLSPPSRESRGGSSTSVLQSVIASTVNSRLEKDLKDAFDKGRTEMLNAAAEVGKKALQAAVSKAFS